MIFLPVYKSFDKEIIVDHVLIDNVLKKQQGLLITTQGKSSLNFFQNNSIDYIEEIAFIPENQEHFIGVYYNLKII